MLRFGVLGAGRIGKVHARTIAASGKARVAYLADAMPKPAEELAAEVGARIASLPLPEGSRFARGQLLLAFDCSLQQAQLLKAQAEVAQAQATYRSNQRLSELNSVGQLELDLSPRRVDLLGEGFDVALRMGALPDDASLAARRLADFSFGLYAAPSYLAEHGEPKHPDELARHSAIRMLQANGDIAAWALSQGDQHWQGTPPGRMSANAPELLIKLACAGAGIAAVPDHFAAAEVRRGMLRRVLPVWCLPTHTAWAVFPERKLMPVKTRVFIDMLQAALSQVPT